MEKTDDVLVTEIQGGSLDAFEPLMRRYEKLVCKVAIHYVRDKANALDVTQNVFLKVYQNMHRVTADGMFKPWLLRITYNESINWLRKRKHDPMHDELDESLPATGAPTAEEHVERKENQGILLEALDKLNPKYKLAVALRYAEGMRIKEIAGVMGCSEGVVKSLLFRGVRQIQKNVARSV